MQGWSGAGSCCRCWAGGYRWWPTRRSTEFGTGALKVTPGHDPSDFEIGQRHGLPIVNVMNLDGTMNEAAGPYQGQDRVRVPREDRGAARTGRSAEGVEPNPTRWATATGARGGGAASQRQWYVRMEPLARPAREAVRDGRIRIVRSVSPVTSTGWTASGTGA